MTQVALPTITPTPNVQPATAPTLNADERDRLIRQAKTLSWLSLGWMTIEGTVAITAALLAGSVALLGFGIDSGIEALASIIVIWRFTGSRRVSDARRAACPEARRDQLLPARPLHRPRRDPRADRRPTPIHELAGIGSIDLEHRADATARPRQAADRVAP